MMIEANREKYNLVRDGVLVPYRDESGTLKRGRLRVFDFYNHEENHFLCVRELWINLACQSWNEKMWSDGGPIDPSPTIDQASTAAIREPCAVCAFTLIIAFRFSLQFECGVNEPIHDYEWLCPVHHKYVHVLLSGSFGWARSMWPVCLLLP
jgi:hypothetical protein